MYPLLVSEDSTEVIDHIFRQRKARKLVIVVLTRSMYPLLASEDTTEVIDHISSDRKAQKTGVLKKKPPTVVSL
jgi:hypothetical protein